MTIKAELQDGTVMEFPDGTDPAVIQQTVRRHLSGLIGSVADVEKLADRSSGSPMGVRHAVGGASTTRDRLATLRQFYPDAQPYGPDNFIFTDPQSGRATLYNPPGLDAGDFASTTPEMAEIGGGIIGGAAAVPPALAAAIPTGGVSLATIPIGVGLGAAAGREIENLGAMHLGSRIDTRGLPERLVDAGTTAGVNAVGQRVGDLAVQGARKFIGDASRRTFTRSTPTELRTAFENQSITPTPGAISGSRTVQIAEQGLANTPGGASVMQGVAERTVGQMGERVRSLAETLGRRMSPQGTGAALREAAEGAGQRFAQRREALDQSIEDTIGGNTLVPLANVQSLIGEMRATLRMAPKSLNASLAGAIQELDNLVSDAAANGGKIPFAALRKVRTRVGQDLKRPDAAGYRPGEQQYIARIYGALSGDIDAAATAAGPDALNALKLHDRYVRLNRTINIPALDRITKARTDEQAFQIAMQGADRGGTELLRLRRNLPPEAMDELASTVLYRMGQARPGQQGAPVELLGEGDTFSPNTFLTNWSKLSPEAKRALFGGTRYEDLTANLDDLVKIAASLKDAEKMANPSGTARQLLFSALSYGAGQTLTGSVSGGVSAAAGSVVVPYVSARLLTSPGFTRWLAGSRMVGNNPNSFLNHLGRLAIVAQAEPEIREELDQYLAAIRSAPATQSLLGGTAGAGSASATAAPGAR